MLILIIKAIVTVGIMLTAPRLCQRISEKDGADKILGILGQIILWLIYLWFVLFV